VWDLKESGTKKKAKLAEKVLKEIHPSGFQSEKLFFALQALLNLYYPTDDKKWTGPLHILPPARRKSFPIFS